MVISGELVASALNRPQPSYGDVEIPLSTPYEVLLRSSADQKDRAFERVLAIFVAEFFSILHPATLPMLLRMFEDVKKDAENDGELELKWRAEIGMAAAEIALREQEALDT